MFLKSDFLNKSFIFILFILLFVFYFFVFNKAATLPLLGGINANLRVNLEGINQEVYLNDKKLLPLLNFSETTYLVYGTDNFEINSLEIKGKEAFVTLDNKMFHMKDFKGKFPYKYLKNGRNISDKGFLKAFQVYFLSLFYNTKLFMLLFFLIGFLVLKSPPKHSIWAVLFLALVLRLADLDCGLWTDEYYSVYLAGNSKLPFLTTFKDPGNPPLFFILIWFFEKLTGYNDVLLRVLPISFSVLSCYLIYLFVQKNLDEKAALVCAFLFGINIYSIVSAQEIRSYSLLILMSLALSYLLFELIKKGDEKNFIIYGILGALILNVHYFGAIILISNFLFGLIFIKEKLKFLFINLFSGLFFLPYFLMTGLNSGLLDNNFNSNILMPNLNFYLNVLIKLSQGVVPVLILMCLCIFSIVKKNRICIYSFFMILSVFILSYILSFIKPIVSEYYFICVLPYFLILFSSLFLIQKKSLKIILVVLFLLSYFGFRDYVKRERNNFSNFKSIFLYADYDSENKKDAAVILPYSKNVMENVFSGMEIFELTPPYDVEKLLRFIDNLDKKRIYFKLEYKIAPDFLKKASEKYNVSFIRVNKDAIIARVIKGE